jgi:acetyl esterase/lipase
VIFSINKKYNNLSNHIKFNKMKKIIALVLMLLTLVGVSAQEISNDEYNRLKMARQKFAGFDTDKNGVLNQEDLSGIKSPNKKKQFEQVLKKQEVISKEDYISNYKVTLEEWDGERISNVVYKRIGDIRLMLDIYLPPNADKKKLPVVMFFHGGGLQNGSKDAIGIKRDVIESLAKEQIAYISVNYRLINFNDIFAKDCTTDAKDALRFIKKEGHKFGLDADKVVTWGISAGARLSQMLSFTDENDFEGDAELFNYPVKPIGAISWCGATAFHELYDGPLEMTPRVKQYLKKFTLEEDMDLAVKEVELITPVSHVDKNDPPLLMVHGDSDRTVNVQHSYIMADYLKKFKVPYKQIIVKNGGHNIWEGNTIEPSAKVQSKITADFAIKLLTK